MKLRLWLPLLAFAALTLFLALGLRLKPAEVPSPFIGKAAPAFSLALLHRPKEQFTPAQLKGQVWLLNVWASWCASCRDEHPLLVELAQQKLLPIYGLNYKDEPAKALAWLQDMGDPYTASLIDGNGRVGIDYGVYGVPETFVIDAAGIVRFKHIGPLTREVWAEKLLPLIKKLKA